MQAFFYPPYLQVDRGDFGRCFWIHCRCPSPDTAGQCGCGLGILIPPSSTANNAFWIGSQVEVLWTNRQQLCLQGWDTCYQKIITVYSLPSDLWHIVIQVSVHLRPMPEMAHRYTIHKPQVSKFQSQLWHVVTWAHALTMENDNDFFHDLSPITPSLKISTSARKKNMCAQRLWTMVVHLWPFPRCKGQCRCLDLVHLYDWDIPVWYTNWFTMKIMCIVLLLLLLYNIIWLVVWNMYFMTFHNILGIMIPIDELIFFRGVGHNYGMVRVYTWILSASKHGIRTSHSLVGRRCIPLTGKKHSCYWKWPLSSLIYLWNMFFFYSKLLVF